MKGNVVATPGGRSARSTGTPRYRLSRFNSQTCAQQTEQTVNPPGDRPCGTIENMRGIRVRFIVGSDGRKEAVLLGMAEYHRLMSKLEDLQDALALDRAERTSTNLIPYSSVQKRLKRAGKL